MSRLSEIRASLTSEPLGWQARLYRHWVLYNALAFTIILATVYILSGLGLGVTRQAAGHIVASLLIAVTGALIYGVVLGSLQWRVLRQRIPIPRRKWIISCLGTGTARVGARRRAHRDAYGHDGREPPGRVSDLCQSGACSGAPDWLLTGERLASLHHPMGVVDRRKRRLLAARRRDHLPALPGLQQPQLRQRRRISRRALPDAPADDAAHRPNDALGDSAPSTHHAADVSNSTERNSDAATRTITRT